MADPGPVAQCFFADAFCRAKCRLDGVLTLVDAKHFEQSVDDQRRPSTAVNEAQRQVSFADRILLNKCDLVSADQARRAVRRLRSINHYAPVLCTTNSQVDLEKVFGMNAFSVDRAVDIDAGWSILSQT
jgi:G3E family GTPase